MPDIIKCIYIFFNLLFNDPCCETYLTLTYFIFRGNQNTFYETRYYQEGRISLCTSPISGLARNIKRGGTQMKLILSYKWIIIY